VLARRIGFAAVGLNDQHSQSPAGVLGLFGFSLFLSLGFVLFGQQRLEPSATKSLAEDQHRA
jgi:hypothetical protein